MYEPSGASAGTSSCACTADAKGLGMPKASPPNGLAAPNGLAKGLAGAENGLEEARRVGTAAATATGSARSRTMRVPPIWI